MQVFTKNLKFIKQLLLDNNYPIELIDRHIEKTLDFLTLSSKKVNRNYNKPRIILHRNNLQYYE